MHKCHLNRPEPWGLIPTTLDEVDVWLTSTTSTRVSFRYLLFKFWQAILSLFAGIYSFLCSINHVSLNIDIAPVVLKFYFTFPDWTRQHPATNGGAVVLATVDLSFLPLITSRRNSLPSSIPLVDPRSPKTRHGYDFLTYKKPSANSLCDRMGIPFPNAVSKLRGCTLSSKMYFLSWRKGKDIWFKYSLLKKKKHILIKVNLKGIFITIAPCLKAFRRRFCFPRSLPTYSTCLKTWSWIEPIFRWRPTRWRDKHIIIKTPF